MQGAGGIDIAKGGKKKENAAQTIIILSTLPLQGGNVRGKRFSCNCIFPKK